MAVCRAALDTSQLMSPLPTDCARSPSIMVRLFGAQLPPRRLRLPRIHFRRIASLSLRGITLLCVGVVCRFGATFGPFDVHAAGTAQCPSYRRMYTQLNAHATSYGSLTFASMLMRSSCSMVILCNLTMAVYPAALPLGRSRLALQLPYSTLTHIRMMPPTTSRVLHRLLRSHSAMDWILTIGCAPWRRNLDLDT